MGDGSDTRAGPFASTPARQPWSLSMGARSPAISRISWHCRESERTRPELSQPLLSVSAIPWSTRMCAESSPVRSPGYLRLAPRRQLPIWQRLSVWLPPNPATAALVSIAFMELGALLCSAATPTCAECPLQTQCSWRLSGFPSQDAMTAAGDGPKAPTRRRRSQGYIGTDRQVRGLLLAVLRESAEPVPRARLDLVWHDPVQRDRALTSLVTDGLASEEGANHYALPS